MLNNHLKIIISAVLLQSICGVMLPGQAFCQKPGAVTLKYGYLQQVRLPSGLRLKSISGDGFEVQTDFRLSERFSLLLEGGYYDAAIDQDDAVELWNWPFWERFYRNYVRSLVSRDSIYSVVLTPNQNLYMIPVMLGLEYEFPVNRFKPFVSIFGGVTFYERNLRLNEKWTKYFPDLDYRFQYEYDNHADVRKGEVISGILRLGTAYVLNQSFALKMSVNYRYYYVTDSDRNFPLRSSIGIGGGLVFYY